MMEFLGKSGVGSGEIQGSHREEHRGLRAPTLEEWPGTEKILPETKG